MVGSYRKAKVNMTVRNPIWIRYAPVKVSQAALQATRRIMTGVRLTIQETLTTLILFDIILTLQMVENIDLLGGDSDSEG